MENNREQVTVLLEEINKDATEIKRLLDLVIQKREDFSNLTEKLGITVNNATETEKELAIKASDLIDSIEDTVIANF